MEFMYLVFTRIPGESYRKRKRLERLLTPLCAFMYLVFTRIPGESYRKRKRLERLLTPLCADFVLFCLALIFLFFYLI